MDITSKSKLDINTKFSLDLFKKPFCFNERKKKYKLYSYPKFKNSYFYGIPKKELIKQKVLFISGPARSGNHLLLSMFDGHTQIANEVGEDDFLRSIFSYANINEKEIISKLKSGILNNYLNFSGQPKFGRGLGSNKWKKLYLLDKLKIKTKFWSGTQPEGGSYVTDFKEFVPKINYSSFENYLKLNSDSLKKSHHFITTMQIYMEAKNKLLFDHEKKKHRYIYKYRWTGSGLRRELFYLMKRSKKIICVSPIRKFDSFYFSYAKTRHNTTKIDQKAVNNLWEHWRHKVVDYLLLKKFFPNQILIVKYEDLVNKPESTMRKICKKLKVKFEKSMLKPTVLGKKTLGNSSFENKKNIKGKIYKTSINKKLNINMPKEYFEIYKHINKVCL